MPIAKLLYIAERAMKEKQLTSTVTTTLATSYATTAVQPEKGMSKVAIGGICIANQSSEEDYLLEGLPGHAYGNAHPAFSLSAQVIWPEVAGEDNIHSTLVPGDFSFSPLSPFSSISSLSSTATDESKELAPRPLPFVQVPPAEPAAVPFVPDSITAPLVPLSTASVEPGSNAAPPPGTEAPKRARTRTSTQQWRPLGPRHLEYDYHVAHRALKDALYEELVELGYRPPKGRARTPCGWAPGPDTIPALKRTPAVARAARALDAADYALDAALARGETWADTPVPRECTWAADGLQGLLWMRLPPGALASDADIPRKDARPSIPRTRSQTKASHADAAGAAEDVDIVAIAPEADTERPKPLCPGEEVKEGVRPQKRKAEETEEDSEARQPMQSLESTQAPARVKRTANKKRKTGVSDGGQETSRLQQSSESPAVAPRPKRAKARRRR